MLKRAQRNRAKEWQWRRLIRQWQRSGLSARAFCAQQGVSEPNFYAWRREIARRNQEQRPTRPKPSPPATEAPAFVRLALPAGADAASALEVVVAAGRVVRVRPGFDAALLRQLLRVLEEPPC